MTNYEQRTIDELFQEEAKDPARVVQTKRVNGGFAPMQMIKGGEKDADSQANKNYKARY